MAGVPQIAIQASLGHADPRMTDRYMSLAPVVRRAAADALNRPPNWRHLGNAEIPAEKSS
jgi:integrase